jgi:hypothetical protein
MTVSEGSEKLTGLRDVRKPCHFWVDNEVADCYQPIVGADAIWVYCRIARNAHGAWIVSPKRRDGDTRVSLREMAEWCGKSVDTVWRCLQVLEHVGLMRALRGAKSSGRYALADVKDLVTREGGQYDRTMGSFQLPPARVAALQAEVKALRAKLARKASCQLSVVGGQEAVASVAQSDSLESGLFAAADAECDSSVAPSDTSVAPDAQPSITQEGKPAKQTTTPQPPQAGACGLDLSDDPPFTEEQRAHLAKHANDAKWTAEWTGFYREENRALARERAKAAEAARVEAERVARLKAELGTVAAGRAYVMRECRFQKSRRGRGIEQTIDGVLEQGVEIGEPLWETAPRMAEAWKSFQANSEYIDVHWGPVNFFKLGIWSNARGWAWNEAKLERRRAASVGSR